MTEHNFIMMQESYHNEIVQYFDEDSEFMHLLEPLLKALGWQGSYKHIVETLPHYAKTLDITGFRNVMAMLNFHSHPIKVQLNEIMPELLPAVFIPDNEPAMLLLSSGGKHLIAYKTEDNSYQTILPDSSSGTLYVFEDMRELKTSDDKTTWFTRNIARFKSMFAQVLAISFIINLFLLVTPLFIMGVFDKVFSSDSSSMLFQLGIGVIIALVGSLVLSKIRTHILSYIGARLDVTVGDAILERLLFLPPSFTENATVGAQVARIKDFDSIREFFTSPSLSVLFELPFAIMFLVVIWLLGGWIVLVPLCMLMGFALLFYVINPYIVEASEKTAHLNSEKQAFQLETISNMRSIRLLGISDQWLERYKSIASKTLASEFFSSQITQTLNIIAETIMMISGLLVIGLGVIQVIEGHMSIGALIATMMLVWRVLGPIKTFFSMLPRLDQISTSIKQINQLMKIPVERNPRKIVQPLTDKLKSITFSRVSFRYRSDMLPTLLGVNFTIQPGELVAICGQNGSGKSTLLKLISSLYPIQAGNILLDDINIRQMDVIELRHALGYLPQNTVLFYGTIAQNLRFANTLATDEELIEATKLAGVFEDIQSLPKGFETRVEDHAGSSLSRSFQQRLMLARTYLKRSSILLLDEPTNYMDFEMTEQFNHTIKSLQGNTTILLVTHRPAQMKMADRVLYLDQGRLMFNGSPEEVLPKIPMSFL